MYDKYDNPYSGQPDMPNEGEPNRAMEAISGIADRIKANWKKIAAILLVLIVGYFAYDFFIGGMREVQLNTQDTEGKTISGTIKLYSQDGKEIKTLQTGQKISLRKGTYLADASAPDYKPLIKEEFSVSESGPQKMILEQDKDIEIQGNIPESFFSGEEKEMQIAFKNSGEKPEQVTLVIEGDAKDALDLDRKTFNVPSGEKTENVKISAKASARDTKAFGENKKAVIRVQGLGNSKAKIEAKYSLIKFDPKDIIAKIDSSDTTANYGKIRTGQQGQTRTLKIQNKTQNQVNDLQAAIEITESGFLDADTVKKWFVFNPSNTISAGPDSQEQMNIIIRVPSDVKFPEGLETEKITGTITVGNSYYEHKFSLSFEIEKTEAKIDMSGLDESYPIGKENNAYKPRLGLIRVRNTGDVTLKDFSLRVSCIPQTEGTSWLTVEGGEETTIASLQKDESKEIGYQVQVPANTKPGTSSTCSLVVFFYDPSGTKLSVEKKTIINAA